MQLTKKKIDEAVKQYTQLFPSEYKAFLTSTRAKKAQNQNDFAELKQSDMIERHLMDIPETLYYALRQHLTDEEFDWLYGKNTHHGKREGIAWFMRKYPQFRITKEF